LRILNNLKIFLLVTVSGFVFMIISGIAFYIYIASNAPDFTPDALYVSEPSELLDINGNTYAKLGSEKRVIVTYDELPEVLIDAIVATEPVNHQSHACDNVDDEHCV